MDTQLKLIEEYCDYLLSIKLSNPTKHKFHLDKLLGIKSKIQTHLLFGDQDNEKLLNELDTHCVYLYCSDNPDILSYKKFIRDRSLHILL